MTMSEVIGQELENFNKRRVLAGSMMSGVLEDGFEAIAGEDHANFGTAPFLVLDNDDVMGLLDEQGEFVPFPYGYELDEDVIDADRFDTVFSTLGAEGAILRLIPAKTDFEPPKIESGEFFETEHKELPGVLWEGVDLATGEVAKLVQERLGGALTRKFASLHDRVARLAAEEEIEIPEGLNGQVLLVQAMADGNQLLRLVLAAYMNALREIDSELEQASDEDIEDEDEDDEDEDD